MLLCSNGFTVEVLNKPEILSLVAQKAAAVLGRPVRVSAVDKNAAPRSNQNMDALLNFGRAHSDIVRIKKP